MASAPSTRPPGPQVAGIHVSGGGVPKLPVAAAQVTRAGLEGDVQRELRFHGGPDRAVSLYAVERLRALAAEGHPIAPGSTGENLTLAGLDWAAVAPGCQLRVGEGLCLLVTAFCTPCRKIAGSFQGGDYKRISQKLNPGWSRVYARVLTPGAVRLGDPVELVPAPAAEAG